MSDSDIFDLAVIGGGINGAGIACDAAGRGARVLLVEAGDLAGATSSASSKLIHGGLRYLEHYEFRLVREALQEREVLLGKAPHIIWPLRFIIPHGEGMRPRWMLRAGLFLYDHLYRRRSLPGSRSLSLAADPAGAAIKASYRDGFAYWDCWVDDARLVVLNARAAAEYGATVLTRTRLAEARAENGLWRLRLQDDTDGAAREERARALVNATGPWVGRTRALITPCGAGPRTGNAVRLIKGSHIVVAAGEAPKAAYLLQNSDGRVVFVLPFEERFTLIGTTETPFDGDPGTARIDDRETDYLLASVARFFARPPDAARIVWSFSGVRPLSEDGSDDPSAVTRDYRLEIAGGDGQHPPLLTVYGGKITTYRRLAEKALGLLAPYLPMGGPWTASAPLPGGEMDSFDTFLADLIARRSGFDRTLLRRLARRHGSLTDKVLGDARKPHDLGHHIGAHLYAREVDYLKRHEWARTAEDVLWRRTKAGLHLTPAERSAASEAIDAML